MNLFLNELLECVLEFGYWLINNRTVICQTFTVTTFCVIILKKNNYKLIIRIVTNTYPLTLLLGLISGSLLLMAFIISFHSEVFTQNDKYDEPKSRSGSKRNGYSWFNLVDIYQFPIDQFLLDQFYKAKNKLNMSEIENITNYHVIIIDKTGSTKESKNDNRLFAIAKSLLIKKIQINNLECNTDLLKSFADVLMLASVINSIEQGTEKIIVGFYQGRGFNPSDTLSPILYKESQYKVGNSLQVDNNTRLKEFMNKIDSSVIKQSKNPYSDFGNMFLNASEKALRQTSPKDPKIMLTIISDFDHDYPPSNDLSKVHIALKSIMKLDIHKLNAFVMLGKSSDPNLNLSRPTLDCITQEFEDELLPDIIWCNDRDLLNNPQMVLNSIITNPNRALGLESEISAFFPINKFYSLRRGSTTMYLYDRNDNPYEGDIQVTLKSSDPKTDIGKANLTDLKTNLVLNKKGVIPVKNGEINITFPSWLTTSGDYYLDIFSEKEGRRFTAPITFREKLTNTSSEALIFLFSLLYSSVTTFLSIIGWKWINLKNSYKRKYKIILYLFTIIIPVLIFARCFCGLLYDVCASSMPGRYLLLIAGVPPVVFVSFLIYNNLDQIFRNTKLSIHRKY